MQQFAELIASGKTTGQAAFEMGLKRTAGGALMQTLRRKYGEQAK